MNDGVKGDRKSMNTTCFGAETAQVLVLPVRATRIAQMRSQAGRPVSLLHPSFEREAMPSWRRWRRRWQWRRDLANTFGGVPETVLADFGLNRQRLQEYVARPVWQA